MAKRPRRLRALPTAVFLIVPDETPQDVALWNQHLQRIREATWQAFGLSPSILRHSVTGASVEFVANEGGVVATFTAGQGKP